MPDPLSRTSIRDRYDGRTLLEIGRKLPLRGLFQAIKLVGSILAVILAVSIMIGKSPMILISGLGAMTAVLMLVFRDPIMGLVAGIQLSTNNMMSVGDWLEMPKYGADGDVIDISLTTVNVDPASPANGRRLINLGTFRAYLSHYLKAHPKVHQGMIQMVRQLASGPNGIPLEIYAFASTTAWVEYEGIQADIFDHIFAVLPEFGLRVYQNPTGHDLLMMSSRLSPGYSGRNHLGKG